MNQHLQNILNFLHLDKNLSDEEKNTLTKSLNNANKELELTVFKLDRTEKVKRTTAILLEETIEELEQKQKAVIAQNRELEIEASLEKVRSRSLAMQKSEELADVAEILFKQVRELGIQAWSTGFNIWQEGNESYIDWITSPTGGFVDPYTVDLTTHPFFREISEAKKSGTDFQVFELSGEPLAETYELLMSFGPKQFEGFKAAGFSFPTHQFNHYVFGTQVGLMFITPEPHPEDWDIFKRFGQVFEQTYTRFLDLKKAEEQARESQIQLAMERVRARTMSMQNSDELPEAATLMFQQIKSLGIHSWSCGFNIWGKGDKSFISNMSGQEGKILDPMEIPLTEEATFIHFQESRDRGDKLFIDILEGEVIENHYKYFKALPGVKEAFDSQEQAGLPTPTFQINHIANFSHGNLMFITYEPCPEGHDIFIRFAKVFEQTYTRFLDLQKAEAQAREAEIELALERVRARTMAMQNSNELADAAAVLFQQVKNLGIDTYTTGFNIWDVDHDTLVSWMSNPTGVLNPPFIMPAKESEQHNRFYEAWKNNIQFIEDDLAGKKIVANYKYLRSFPLLETAFATAENAGIKTPDRQVHNVVFFSHGYLLFVTLEPKPEFQNMFKRFGQVFQQTYTRFLDLQKAEAQAREAKIEAALERVRSRTMAMHKPDELLEAAELVHKELSSLGITSMNVSYAFVDDEEKSASYYSVNPVDGKVVSFPFVFPHTETEVMRSILSSWKKQKPFHVIDMDEDATLKHQTYIGEHVLMQITKNNASIPFSVEAFLAVSPKKAWIYTFNFTKGYLFNIGAVQLTKAQEELVLRFTKVFNQTYTRFLDLQKAEAQAKEAMIEAGLERVRSKTMAMHNSQDVGDTVALMFDELVKLEVKTNRCGILIFSKSMIAEVWTAKSNLNEKASLIIGKLDLTMHPLLQGIYHAWENKKSFFTYTMIGDDLISYYQAINNTKYYPTLFELNALPSKEFHSDFYFAEGSIFSFTDEILIEEATIIFKRFAGVFGQTYRRYLDLQKAEAQAREAQIEAALERVRSRSIAMRTSPELKEVALELRKQLGLLGQKDLEVCAIHLYDDENSFESWSAMKIPNKAGGILQTQTRFPNKGIRIVDELMQHYKKGSRDYVLVNEKEKVVEWLEVLKAHAPETRTMIMQSIGKLPVKKLKAYWSIADFSGGALVMITYTEPDATSRNLLRRSANVFEQAYIRFLDLQKAEAQAREAQIELAMERVRARTMAMQKSTELQDASLLLFQQVQALGIPPFACGFNIWDADKKSATAWMGSIQGLQPPFKTSSAEDIYLPIYEASQRGDLFFVQEQAGKELEIHYQYLATIPVFRDIIMVNREKDGVPFPTYQIMHCAFFSHGYLMFITFEPVKAVEDIFKRFAKVFEQTYIRFLDLQKAEEQTRESQIETALERVRSRTLAMQKSDELAETAVVVFKQLNNLGIEPTRLYIGIIKEDNNLIEFWITDEDGSKVITQFTADASKNGSMKKMYEAWKEQEKSLTIEMKGKELADYFQYLSSDLHVSFKQILSQKKRIQNIAFFGKGFIGMASPDVQPEEAIHLLERFAAVFNLTYTRFNDLQIAEHHAEQADLDLIKLQTEKRRAEDALKELRSTQTQLIQSEKMASLGELTAGIAHEIQNPLNFVNNFSEVSSELIDEMNEEIEKGNLIDAKLISNDLKDNLFKINHHGKRAGEIVRSMLQHSRRSSGQKEPTDINALTDEYLRLAYHGLRAKDKSFNATMKTHFDTSIEKINLIPQDFGRVILNLITNAFYVVNEKKKTASANYEPTVILTTKKSEEAITISVTDNGNGIPKHIVEKIFQPFFTTKPTGQGTGLGLSLSYDIVKSHGGDISVETKDREGSIFTIKLPI